MKRELETSVRSTGIRSSSMDTLANSRQSPQDADWVSRSEKLSFEVRNFIDGQWVAQREGPALQKYGPREGRALYRVARGDISEVNVAVESARRAFSDGRWSRLPMRRRKDALAALA